MSRIRNKEYNTVHHLTSRIAHRAFFLKDEERNDFVDLMFRVSAFSGVELWGWAVMNNHFHILAYLPQPQPLTDDEVLARFKLLKGDAARLLTDDADDWIPTLPSVGAECQTPRATSADQIAARAELVKSIRRRMYSIAEYMRMVKKWFSDNYNERNGHKGTMWEAVYGDRAFPLPESPEDYDHIRTVLGYIHLNPVRAAVVESAEDYQWSSFSAFCRGDEVAASALRNVYSGMCDTEIVDTHKLLIDRLTEEWKRKRANEIARKRLAGYAVESVSVTDECLVAQSRELIERVQAEVMRLQMERKVADTDAERRSLICRQIVALTSICPEATPRSLSLTLEVSLRSVQRYIGDLLKSGRIIRGYKGQFALPAA